ncbi:MAG: HAD family hydrolase [Ignavibacteria bacterium]|nr:HAD family hydrolase [Ignavibacteria bacterium]
MPHLEKLSAVIFDMDGTITRSNDLIFGSFNCVAKKYLRKTFSPKEITALFGPAEEGAIEKLIGKEKLAEAMQDFWNFYRENHSICSLYDGIIDLFEFLREHNIKIGLFTGKGKISTHISLQQFCIEHYFDYIVTGHDVTKHKPSGEGIEIILRELSLDKNETLMVGDAISDMKASAEVGVPCAVALWDSYALEEILLLNPELKFFSVSEFSNWLKENVLKQSTRHPELVSGTFVQSK